MINYSLITKCIQETISGSNWVIYVVNKPLLLLTSKDDANCRRNSKENLFVFVYPCVLVPISFRLPH